MFPRFSLFSPPGWEALDTSIIEHKPGFQSTNPVSFSLLPSCGTRVDPEQTFLAACIRLVTIRVPGLRTAQVKPFPRATGRHYIVDRRPLILALELESLDLHSPGHQRVLAMRTTLQSFEVYLFMLAII